MKNELLTLAEASARIEAGDIMTIAGSAEMLRALPRGNWIGGTTVYFVTDKGGEMLRDRVFCTTFTKAQRAVPRHVAAADLASIPQGYIAGGVTMIMIPAFSKAHEDFALQGQDYDGIFDQPLAGWVTGVHLDEIGREKPLVFDGATGLAHDEGALLMHIALPDGAAVDLDILNIFKQREDMGQTLRFDHSGFTATTAILGGREVKLADYITQQGIDLSLPLMANYAGAMVNVSVRDVDAATGMVTFYAPVVAGAEYRFAAPLTNYAAAFADGAEGAAADQFSCNCILNYIHGEMEGKRAGHFTGPVTFGEIAYILLNQTLVRLDIQSPAKAAA